MIDPSCGGSGSGLSHEYFYLSIDHGAGDDHEVVWIVVEDTIDAEGNALSRKVIGQNSSGRMLRHARITDPDGTPSFWCKSWKLVDDTGGGWHCQIECHWLLVSQ